MKRDGYLSLEIFKFRTFEEPLTTLIQVTYNP